MILEAGLQGNTMVELPPLSLYSMTKPQLEEFIPRLINLACTSNSPTKPTPPSPSFYKPEWWPVDVPWVTPKLQEQENLCKKFLSHDSTDKLRSVVQACYEYMGHKELLSKPNTNMEASLACLKANTNVLAVESSDDDSEPEVVDVYVCFYCDHWFGGKEGKTKLEEHVLTHMDKVSGTSVPSSDLCEASSFDSVSRVPEQSRKSPSRKTKQRLLVTRPPKRCQEVPLWERSDVPCNNGVCENEFLKTFGLISSKQAKTVASKSKPEMDIDCEIVAVEGLDSRPLTSPRTPRSLMSQLSREGEGSSRKRLSFSMPDDASDGENTEASTNKNIQGALLNVPFSSLLGKRVKKHIKPDSSACTIKDPEEYCSTVNIRNEFLDKLRFRVNDYPVTYRKKKKYTSKFAHEYKFNREQTVEFLKKMKTGLNKESRQLKRKMKKFNVIIKRLSKEEINFWKERKHKHGAEWIDDDISIVEIEPAPRPIDKSRLYHASTSGIIRPMRPNPMQTPSQNSSILQARNPYLMQQISARHPQQCTNPKSVPQFLVKKVEKQFNGHQSSKLVYVPISELKPGPQKRIEPRWNPHQSSQHGQPLKTWGEHTMVADRRTLVPTNSSRRKQHFVNVRKELDNESDVSVHSQSSDEDSDIGNKMNNSKPNPSLCVANQQRNVSATARKHMVMSATGEFVKTVGQKARKSFGKASSVLNAQALRHFTSHPIQKTGSPNQHSVKPETLNHSFGVSGGVKPMYRPEPVRTKVNVTCGVNNVPRASPQVKPPSSALPQQPVLRVVDDVIYIDDDD